MENELKFYEGYIRGNKDGLNGYTDQDILKKSNTTCWRCPLCSAYMLNSARKEHIEQEIKTYNFKLNILKSLKNEDISIKMKTKKETSIINKRSKNISCPIEGIDFDILDKYCEINNISEGFGYKLEYYKFLVYYKRCIKNGDILEK